MMSNGILTIDETGNGRGQYTDLTMKAKIGFEPIDNGGKAGSDHPSHDVYIDMGNGFVHCGAAWKKKGDPGGRLAGQIFYSFSIDDPSFNQPLNLSAFPNKNKGEFDIVWRRKREAAAA